MTNHIYYRGLSPSGFHKLHASYFPTPQPASADPVVCVHGLARNCRDFDFLGAELSSRGAPVYAADMAGRGESEWLADSKLYAFDQYTKDCTALLARIGSETVSWVGTSMGGLIGMFLAAQPGSPVKKLVMNDVGPFLPKGPLKQISAYMNAERPTFKGLREIEIFLRTIYEGFGALSDAQWKHMAATSSKQIADDSYVLSYDPGIADNTKTFDDDIDLWALYDKVTCPTLVLRGQYSKVLPPEIAEEMTKRGPKASLVTIPDTAHAPSLMTKAHTDIVAAFLFS